MRPRNLAVKAAVALVLTLSAGGAYAQSTSGSIFGTVDEAAGKTVLIQNNAGFSREITVDSQGHYSLGSVPVGNYKITLRQGDRDIDSRDVELVVGAATEVSFTANALTEVDVTGARLRASVIDVRNIDTRTVVTADELAVLPLARTAEAIAFLAPGVVGTSGGYTSSTGTSLLSFGGSAVSENAYYLNGFNTGDPFRNLGGLTLPYGAIQQEEVYTGGYGAEYGRSNGGVINQVGRRGTNDWKFGAQVIWNPDWGRANPINYYYTSAPASSPNGLLYRYNAGDNEQSETYDAYVGGPIIKDHLFFFAAGEFQRTTGNRVNEVTAVAPDVVYDYRDPRWYGKLDWTIIDGQFLEFTGVQDYSYNYGNDYKYYPGLVQGAYIGPDNSYKAGAQAYIGKYTGFFGDHITATALYGTARYPNFNQDPAYDASLNQVTQATPGAQNPAYTNGQSFIGNNQTLATVVPAGQHYDKHGWRGNLNFHFSRHSIDVGVDDQNGYALNTGSVGSGPNGYSYQYNYTTTPTQAVSGASHADGSRGIPGPADFANGAGGYYVIRNYSAGIFSFRNEQRAEYIEDKWQATDRLLLSIGVRDDQFENYDPDNNPVAKVTTPTIAPRLGFSWDVKGDASLKVYGNAGRYYLGLPLGPGGLTTASTATASYFTYSGIDPRTGVPTGLTPMNQPGSDNVVSANARFGTPFDYRTATANGLKGEAQDEFILGLQKALGEGRTAWVGGVRAVFRNLRSAVDDYNDNTPQLLAAAAAQGFTIDQAHNVNGILINPGETNTFNLLGTDGKYHQVTLTREQMDFPDLKRRYLGGEFTLEKPFNGTYYLKFEYVLSHSYGDTEGETRSDLLRAGQTGQSGESGSYTGQAAVSTTQSWDDPALMENFDGDQFNDHRHQLKAYGYYQFTKEWGASLSASAISGSPRPVTGGFADLAYDNANGLTGTTAATDPAGYGVAYHYYNGQPVPPGSFGRLPWVKQVDLGVSYKPAVTDHKLAVNFNVLNLFNSQAVTNVFYASTLTTGSLSPSGVFTPGPVNPLFGTPGVSQQPRSLRLSVSYDY